MCPDVEALYSPHRRLTTLQIGGLFLQLQRGVLDLPQVLLDHRQAGGDGGQVVNGHGLRDTCQLTLDELSTACK